MLIEAMVAILVFSLGVLGFVGLQATSLQHISDAKYRIDAANLTEQLISQMWSENHATATLAAKYASANGKSAAGYAAWAARVASALPGASGHAPAVAVEADGADASRSTVTVVVYWQPPGSAKTHNYTAVSRIR